MPDINVLALCGSLRRGSYNRIVMDALPALDMMIASAPPIGDLPLYNIDRQQEEGFPSGGRRARRGDPRGRRRGHRVAGI